MRGKPFDAADVDVLHTLGHRGVIRAIATGRALATAKKVIPPEFPIDYLIFSSGAGILDWRSQRLLVSHDLQAHETDEAVRVFVAHEVDFMLHEPIPEQHIFHYHRTGNPNADFERRLARYANDGRLLGQCDVRRPASQLIGISPAGDPAEPFNTLCRKLPELSVIRATSPLDGHSMWIEVFARAVSKSQAAAWLAQAHDIVREDARAIGNDYNDWDLLRWAGEAAVIEDAPEAIRAEFTTVKSLREWFDVSRLSARQ